MATSDSSTGSLYGLETMAHEPTDAASELTLTAKPHAFCGAVLSPKHARELTPTLCLDIASALAEQCSARKTTVPYTLWITEAWRVLGWAEPSSALFWEMATMYRKLRGRGKNDRVGHGLEVYRRLTMILRFTHSTQTHCIWQHEPLPRTLKERPFHPFSAAAVRAA